MIYLSPDLRRVVDRACPVLAQVHITRPRRLRPCLNLPLRYLFHPIRIHHPSPVSSQSDGDPSTAYLPSLTQTLPIPLPVPPLPSHRPLTPSPTGFSIAKAYSNLPLHLPFPKPFPMHPLRRGRNVAPSLVASPAVSVLCDVSLAGIPVAAVSTPAMTGPVPMHNRYKSPMLRQL